jgi:hypothetical protein
MIRPGEWFRPGRESPRLEQACVAGAGPRSSEGGHFLRDGRATVRPAVMNLPPPR